MTGTLGLDEIPAARDEALAIAGGKATNLAVMRSLGLPVPPAFVITTEACRMSRSTGWPPGLDEELRSRMAALETQVGRRFGDPADPLLVSVRSGAPVSMPGMMDTILDLGLTEATTAGLAAATGDPAFAASCRERFVSSFRSIVGIDDVPDDPWAQLRLAIEAVFRSWQSDRARAYRAKEGIPEDLGTAVTVQAMVFGNRGPGSGTGVVFTRDPATGERRLFGDILFDAQGDDVVAGTHATESIDVLAERLPAVDAELRRHADRLERHYRDLCDIEFTIEDGRLWFLQVRVGKRSPQAALRIAVDMAEDPDFPLTRAEAVERVRSLLADPPRLAGALATDAAPPLVTGLGASPGVASGPIVTDPAAAVAAAESGTPAILVRAETSPDDVHGMARAAGILTSRGGLASHAAVVARGWGIPAVVGASGVEVGDGRVIVGDRTLEVGDVITIDGATGAVFEGAHPGSSEVVPEAAILLAWAAEAGTTIDADGSATGPIAAEREVQADDLLIPIAIKGLALVGAIADAVAASESTIQPQLDALVESGALSTTAGAYRLTEQGTERVAAIRRREAETWSHEAAGAALDAFLDIDHRVKDVVTAWQLREVDGHQVPNDHADATYDAEVIDRLAAIHEDALAWLGPAEAALERLGTYRSRLTNAIEQIKAGDGKYVASPRVDSYHGIWFELHEDLIQLAGRTRAEEAEAGRT
jgi:pyruvate,orthophosphate dikinase